MKKTITLLFSLCLLFYGQKANASHAMGGEITYTWISGNVYELQFNFYRDCAGILAPSSVTVSASSSCFASMSIPLMPSLNSPQQVAPVCPGLATTCNGGTFNGIEKWSYTGMVTLNGPCQDWTFSVSECCRNTSITNLLNPGGETAYYSAMLNNLAVPFNSSVKMASDPIPYLYVGQSNSYNNGAFDTENDSIVVSFTNALSAPGVSVSYQTGFSGLSPISSSPAMTLDPSTGNILVTPTGIEVDVIAYRIEEYRNGILIGYVTRDIQVTVQPSPNNLPTLSGINGTSAFTLNVCSGDTASFYLIADDLDSNQATEIELLSSNLSWTVNATHLPIMNGNGMLRDYVMISIATDTILPANGLPYQFYFKAKDNSCPYFGNQTYAIQLYVNSCSADVWPGDANSDLNCDMYDLLPIGLAYGTSGPVRANASTNWSAQAATDWAGALPSGVNHKHADCNGDGTVDFSDTTAISLNYGLNHPPRLAPPVINGGAPELRATASVSAAGATDAFDVFVTLGNAAVAASNVYGIAYRISFDPTVIDPSASWLEVVPNQLGTPGTDLLSMNRIDWAAGTADIAMVRTDGTARDLDSVIAVFHATVTGNVAVQSPAVFSILNSEGIDALGNTVLFSMVNDTVDVMAGTTGIQPSDESSIRIFPNPANDKIRIQGVKGMTGVTVLNLEGRIVSALSNVEGMTSLDVRDLPNGTYFAEIRTDDRIFRKRFTIAR